MPLWMFLLGMQHQFITVDPHFLVVFQNSQLFREFYDFGHVGIAFFSFWSCRICIVFLFGREFLWHFLMELFLPAGTATSRAETRKTVFEEFTS